MAELDSHSIHATRRVFEEDRERDRRLAVAGLHVIRITWRHLHREPERLAADLGRLLTRSASKPRNGREPILQSQSRSAD